MARSRPRLTLLGLLSCLVLSACSGTDDRTAQRAPDTEPDIPVVSTEPAPEYVSAVARLTRYIRLQMDDKDLPALSIALVDDQETVWAAGFGFADPGTQVPATPETVYRVGSVSKLFTDLAIMRLVEAGELDLDAPVRTWLPSFEPRPRPRTPGAEDEPAEITLRQLMSHRAGLVREPPVGHYFDDSGPSLEATVASLNETSLVYAPGERIKYSNAGIATVGRVLEARSGVSFPTYVHAEILGPLGMDGSSFEPQAEFAGRVPRAVMWSYDGREFEAPTFELGMAPAGSMYAPVTDLALFMRALFAGGEGIRGRLVNTATLDEMYRPQFAPDEADTGFGIGFAVSRLDGARLVGHGGAIYGFATDLAMLPDARLGSVAATSVDVANSVVSRINRYALRLMRAVRSGDPLPEAETTDPVPDVVAGALEGLYRGASAGGTTGSIRIVRQGGEVYAFLYDFGVKVRLRSRGDTLISDGRLTYGVKLVPQIAAGAAAGTPEALLMNGERFERMRDPRPDRAPTRWQGLIGQYGWDHNVLFVFEDAGQLHVLIEWIEIDGLTELSEDVYAFPERGLYHGERLIFQRGPGGRATSVEVAGILFERRPGPAEGASFTIEPAEPVDVIRERALAAVPPAFGDAGDDVEFLAPDLVEVAGVDSTIEYDIRYAGTNNFMGVPFYSAPHAYLQRPAAEALARVNRRMRERGYGLLIFDAYRPWHVTKMFWDATPENMKIFVADPANGSRHNRGAAVDLTLFDPETGRPVDMVSGYDEFSERAFPGYPGGTSRQRWLRDLLRAAMEAEGFNVYRYEWWHFDYGDWSRYPIGNLTFEELEAAP